MKTPPSPKLSPDELLTTTRAVRRRLDFTRPVEKSLIRECVSIAQQAPTGGNIQDWHFFVVTDGDLRNELAGFYRSGAEDYMKRGAAAKSLNRQQRRVRESALFLIEHLQEVPVHVIPCIPGRTDGRPAYVQASKWASIIPAAWSFMLAARARGLGTAYTTFHLAYEKEVAELLGIPFDEVMQAGLIPVAYTRGAPFKRAARPPPESVIHWDQW